MALTFTVGERMRAGAAEWADQRMMDDEEALETKVEQALLEVEHLVSGGTDVTFELEEGERVRFSPSDDLARFLDEQSDETGIDPARLLKLHVELFSNVFLGGDDQRPGNAPPTG